MPLTSRVKKEFSRACRRLLIDHPPFLARKFTCVEYNIRGINLIYVRRERRERATAELF
jgi:hypothetical protein